jgi:hypothetical protein
MRSVAASRTSSPTPSMKLEYLFIGLNDASFKFGPPGVTFGYEG